MSEIKFALFDCILFITFYTLAVINRKNFQQHGAFMIATGLIFINPSLAKATVFYDAPALPGCRNNCRYTDRPLRTFAATLFQAKKAKYQTLRVCAIGFYILPGDYHQHHDLGTCTGVG
ncbi:hypothetical protein [Mucilaginibacter gossypiicola]|nr:hypothetical protein [Mucilaginibacter gossypiicola]